MNELIAIVEQLALEVVLNESEDPLQQRVERRLVRPDGRDADLGPLKYVVIAHLGRGHLELIANPALQALDNHPLLFEAAAAGQMQVKDSVRNHHVVVWRQAWSEESERFA